MIKPLFVFISFSENAGFKEKSLMTFEAFELKCFSVTKNFKPQSGYDKTYIQVLFSDGTQDEIRLDLNENCRGYKDDAFSYMSYVRKCQNENKPVSEYLPKLQFLENVTW
jgi:hypothetical protein